MRASARSLYSDIRRRITTAALLTTAGLILVGVGAWVVYKERDGGATVALIAAGAALCLGSLPRDRLTNVTVGGTSLSFEAVKTISDDFKVRLLAGVE